MSREVPFDEEALCDMCYTQGAFDFMGDYLCGPCAKVVLPSDDGSGWPEYATSDG